MDTIVITRDDIAQIVGDLGLDRFMDEVLVHLREAFLNFSDTVTDVRTRDGFAYDSPRPSLLEWMPAARVGDCAIVKLVGYNPTNPRRFELPTIVSTLSMYDLATGHLTALCDGTFLTAMRTGAASGLASEVLARPDSAVLGLVGCGAQAVSQLHAHARLFPLQKVLVYDVIPSVAHSFAGRVDFLGLDVESCSLERLEREAEIICTATSVGIGEGPVLDGRHLRPDIHINAVGSDMPGKTELPLSLLHRSLVCPDHTAQALAEGECQQLKNGHVGPSLIEVMKNAPAYHLYRDQSTVFDSTGFALEDMVAMQVLLRHARRLGFGHAQPIEALGYDALNPYSFVVDA